MSAPARFAVVGCSTCQDVWILEDRHEHETATCPQCGATHATTQLRALAQHDDLDVIRELRARIGAQRAGYGDAYGRMDDYAALEEHAQEYLSRYDDLFGADVEQAVERTGCIQAELFAPAAEDYLWRDEPMADEAQDYLDRRQQELNQWVEQSVPTTEDAAPSPTPFSERSEGANLSLTTPETLPENVDVRLRDPPIAPTDMWQQLWQDSAMHTQFRDALDTLRGAEYRDVWATFTETWGATALNDDDVPFAFASYTLDVLKHPAAERWYDVVRLARQLGGPTVLGQSGQEDIINGPIAVFNGSDVRPRIAVHLSHEFFEYKRIQRVRLLEFLVELSRGLDVRIVCHGSLAPKKLLEFHEADLPSRCVTDAPQVYRNAAKRQTTSTQTVAAEALDELGLDHAAISVLERLAEEDNERLEYGALKADDAFSVTEAAVGKRVRTLLDYRLVSKDRFNTANYIQLLPAGVAFLSLHDREQEAQDVQTVLDGFPTAETVGTDAENSDSSELTDPPNHSHGTVYTGASTGGGRGTELPPSAEAVVDVDGVGDDIVASGEWLPTDKQTAVSSAITGDLDIAIADEPASSRDHCGDYQVGFDEKNKEVVISMQPSPCAARTMVRLCAALLDPRLRNSLLTAEQLDSEDGDDLGALLESAINPYVLRKGRQLGWLPDQAATGEAYPEQLLSALHNLLKNADEIGDGDDFDPSMAQSVCRRGHGLAGVITHIYDLLGWTVVRELTFPQYSRHFHEKRQSFLKTLGTQIAVTSRYGHYPIFRVLFEDRKDKQVGSLGAPDVDDVEPVGEPIGSWMLRGPGIDRLASDLAHLERYADLEIQEDGEIFVAFYADLRIGQATCRENSREVVDRLCRAKNMVSTRPAMALFSVFTGASMAQREHWWGWRRRRSSSVVLDSMKFAMRSRRTDRGPRSATSPARASACRSRFRRSPGRDPTSLLPNLDVDEDGHGGRAPDRDLSIHS